MLETFEVETFQPVTKLFSFSKAFSFLLDYEWLFGSNKR